MMTVNEYQKQARGTAVLGTRGINGLTYATVELYGGGGELANKLTEHLLAGTEPDTEVLADKLGDVLSYVGAVAHELGKDLETVAQENIDKLAKRKAEARLMG